MRSVLVGLISVVMVVSVVICEAKAHPFAAALPPTVDGPGDGVDFEWARKPTAPMAMLAGGAADIRYSAGGLINAIAARWRRPLAASDNRGKRSVSMSPSRLDDDSFPPAVFSLSLARSRDGRAQSRPRSGASRLRLTAFHLRNGGKSSFDAKGAANLT